MSQAIQKLARIDPNIQLLEQPEPHAVLVDFSASQALEAHLNTALSTQSAYLVGTTGLTQEHFKKLDQAAQAIPVLWAPNTSLGANLLIELTQISSAVLKDFNVLIQDVHHQHKKDSPSGTALALQKAVGKNCEIQSSRIGEVTGVHEVTFSNPYETVSLRHEALDRQIFAQGALLASFFLSQQSPGLYTMKDVLGFPK